MIVGIGCDILELARIEQALERTPKLAARILTATELDEFEAQRFPGRYLAKRFAAKEAAVKALGTGIGRGISWQHFEICKDPLGRPLLALSGKAAAVAETLGISHWHLSYSDEQHYVVAQVIAESR